MRKETKMQNIISVIFENESDGYQMITELRQEPVSSANTEAASSVVTITRVITAANSLLISFSSLVSG